MAKFKPGEVWQVDLGLAAKIRPCLILSDYPKDNELALVVVVPHTTALRGNLWSEHDLEGQQDQDTCDTLPTKGLEQSSFGLFCESIRRESFLQAVLWFSENPAMLDAYRNGDPKVQADIESALSSRTRAAFDRSLYRTIAGASKEILHLLGAADEPE